MFLSAARPSAMTEPHIASNIKEPSTDLIESEADGTEGSHGTPSAVRSRRRISEQSFCPVCSCTLRAGELQTHLSLELERLAKLSGPSPKRRIPAPGTSSNGVSREADGEIAGCVGSDVYERVKKNREKRLRSCRARNEHVTCPVCNIRVTANEAEEHVHACLRKSSHNDDDDESIDVEGDSAIESERMEEDGFGVSYEWCSQVRVRASALQLLDGGELPHGAMRIRRASTDTHLVVDGDEDDLLYGPPQYSPSRIVSNEAADPEVANNTNNEVNNFEDHRDTSFDLEMQTESATPKFSPKNENPTMCHNIIVETLKSRIRELEQQMGNKAQRSEVKCLICIGPYNEPVVSIQCWHVYCEGCWLASLSAKKTCPQCNTITTSQHLRRIYL